MIKLKKLYIIIQEDRNELKFDGDNIMYRIMLVEKGNILEDPSKVLYKYLMCRNLSTGQDSIYEVEELSELDSKVEAMLNGTDDEYFTRNKTFSKGDFIIVRVTDYDVSADIN